jgi:predicted MFS family arabinose efflux permease
MAHINSRSYLLTLLCAIMIFGYIDRVALAIMLQNMKSDLRLSDTQAGIVTGIAFALFYSLMGIPIARWADRGNRAKIITITVALWSLAVALCSTAASFAQLLLIRVGVAVGEAGCAPPAFSLISDYFSVSERPRAVGRYMLAWPLALLLGSFAAGWLNELYGWRAVFLDLAVPGFCLAALSALTLKEPRRGSRRASQRNPIDVSAVSQRPIKEVLGTLCKSRAYCHLVLAFALSYFFGNGILQWQPAFFMRSYGFHTGEVGSWFAIIYGVGGLLGTYLGGELASRHAGNDQRLQFRGLAVLYAGLAFFGGGVYLVRESGGALGMLAFSAVGAAAVNGPMFAATQTLVPARMRAMSIAVVLFFSNLIGLGLGPLAVGMVSDALRPWLGEESLRYALLSMCPGYFWCAWHLWRAGQTLDPEMSAETEDDGWPKAGDSVECSGGG